MHQVSMRSVLAMLAILVIAACQPSSSSTNDNTIHQDDADSIILSKFQRETRTELQPIIDSADVQGAVVVLDIANQKLYSNDFEWAAVQRMPASTFKIPNSIIALETGVVQDDSTLFKWDGTPRRMKIWEQDLIFRDAFHKSCVPCYQEIARKVGATRMRQMLEKLHFGAMDVNEANIDKFWLVGESAISMLEQIDFLQRFYNSDLPISERTEGIMRKMMVIDETDSYKMSGKTGWAIRDGNNNGWFVGFIERDEDVYFFATNVSPNERFNMDMFPRIRGIITNKALKMLGIIE